MVSKSKKNIVLVGFMGAGKTAVGKILARRLERQFIDMDELIEEREQRSISDIFARDGESHFRAIEKRLVQELAEKNGLVIGTGGGVVLNPENIGAFDRSGIVVCLNARPETILKRVAAEGHRPLLEDGEKAQRIKSILQDRKELYARMPRQIQTDGLSCEEVADAVLELFKADAA